MALGAVLLAVAGGTAIGQQAAAGGKAVASKQGEGGLSLMPATMQAQATRTGTLAEVTVANRSAAPMSVTVAPRQWLQAADGKVTPNRRANLAGVSVSEGAFTLDPGVEKKLTVNLNALPAGGAGYGALEVVGLPTDVATRKGVVLGYRVVGVIRLTPAAPRTGLTAGKIKTTKGTAVLPVKNTGNTIDALSGTISVKTALGTRNSSVPLIKVLPGKTVNIPLATKLGKGSATAKVTVNQGGKRALQINKKFAVK